MAPYNSRSSSSPLAGVAEFIRPNIAFIALIFGALVAFEIFNYSTTDHALSDILGDLNFAGLPWSTILALAFCGIDFAGIARLFTPEQGANEPKEVWYLFAAWLLAATMNAVLTWWGVSMAVVNHVPTQNTEVVDPQTMSNVVPVFVAVLVWVIRILIIGTLSMALDRYLHPAAVFPVRDQRIPVQQPMQAPSSAVRPSAFRSVSTQSQPQPAPKSAYARPAALRSTEPSDPFDGIELSDEPAQPSRVTRPEPSYHSLSMSARSGSNRSGSQGDSSESGSSGQISSGVSNRQRRF